MWSGRQDSNLRPTVPKTVALPGCATPRLASLLTSSQKIEKRKDRFKHAIWPETVRNRRNVDLRRVQCWDARCDPLLICHILPRFQHVLPKHIEYQIPHQSTGSRTGLHHAWCAERCRLDQWTAYPSQAAYFSSKTKPIADLGKQTASPIDLVDLLRTSNPGCVVPVFLQVPP